MSRPARFALALAGVAGVVVGAVVLAGALLRDALPESQRQALSDALAARALPLAFLLVAVVALLGLALRAAQRAYVTPVERLTEDARLIAGANPAHRPEATGAAEPRALAMALGTLAERQQALGSEVDERVAAARQAVEEERNRLAALMAQLPQSIIVCNADARVLLYNERAQRLFGSEHVGLGRSVYALLERGPLDHAIEQVGREGMQSSGAAFLATGSQGQLLNVQLAAVPDQAGAASGWVLTVEDVTRRLEATARRDALLRTLTEETRAALGNIRAAIETLLDYPDMGDEQRGRFRAIIRDEALRLSAQLEEAMASSAEQGREDWPLEQLSGEQVLAALAARLAGRWGISARVTPPAEPLSLRVDSHALVESLAHVVGHLKRHGEPQDVELRLEQSSGLARLDLAWEGVEVSREEFAALQDEDGEAPSLPDIAERHAGEVWYASGGAPGGRTRSYVRLLLPVADFAAAADDVEPRQLRLEFYDFELFRQVDRPSELDDANLADLVYTVFDTETTGLDPAAGDEIIALAGTRIVNGRLLRHERFSELVGASRAPSATSERLTGISAAMLAGRPPLSELLPAFERFADETVLVGHNVAFDLRFLQLQEEATGFRLTQPVLDTLLLSAVVHPSQSNHSLEAIAGRVGVDVTARHTAIGDAITTGEVFLKLVELLRAQDITTLGEARAAAARSYLAKISY